MSKQLIGEIIQSLRNLSKWARVTNVRSDDRQFPVTQVTHNGKTTDVVHMTPYGLYTTLPNNSLVWVVNTGDQEENKVGFGNTPDKRFNGLKEGEVVLGNVLTRVNVFFDEGGSLTVTVPDGDCRINVPNGEVVITSPTVRIEGELLVSGDIKDNYGTNTNSINDMRDIFNTHTHTGDSGGTTAVPNQSQ